LKDKNNNTIVSWFAKRLNLDKEVPKYATNPLYGLGGLATACGILLAITGIFLSIGYQPVVEIAYESVGTITNILPYGGVLRGIHRYAADFMIFFAVLHFFRIILTAAYRKPRELTWMIGIIIGVLVILTAYTGYILPLTEMAVAASFIGSGILLSIPYLGEGLFSLLIGSGGLPEMLGRFATFHTVLLPGLIILGLMIHFLLIREHRVSEPYSERQDRTIVRFFPNLLLSEISGIVLISGVIVVIASLMPIEMGLKFEPLVGTPPVEPEWYLLALYAIFKTGLPIFEVGILLVVGLLAILLVIPFIDTEGNRHPKTRPFYTAFAVSLAICIIVFTYWGYVTPGQTIPLTQAAAVGLAIVLMIFIPSIILANLKKKIQENVDTTKSDYQEMKKSNIRSIIAPIIMVGIVVLQIIFSLLALQAHILGYWNTSALFVGMTIIGFALSIFIYRTTYLPYSTTDQNSYTC